MGPPVKHQGSAEVSGKLDAFEQAVACFVAFLYTGISCQPLFVRGHTGCIFTRRIVMSRPMCM